MPADLKKRGTNDERLLFKIYDCAQVRLNPRGD